MAEQIRDQQKLNTLRAVAKGLGITQERKVNEFVDSVLTGKISEQKLRNVKPKGIPPVEYSTLLDGLDLSRIPTAPRREEATYEKIPDWLTKSA